MKSKTHSIELYEESCIGCTDCLKRCPTEAIRVRNGKAVINDSTCIDCGMCIIVCPYHAKRAVTDSLDNINKYKYTVVIPSPAFYPQFKNVEDINIILTVLKQLGFDEVFEVFKPMEIIEEETKKYLKTTNNKPIISSLCPAINRLITMRFPSLIDNILPFISPIELSGQIIRKKLIKQGFKNEDIGIFFISPCAAEKTERINPFGIEKSSINEVVSMKEIYLNVRNKISKINDDEIEILASNINNNIHCNMFKCEHKDLGIKNSIIVDGIDNVIQILEEMENGRLTDVNFIEAFACTGGCIGGPLTIENSFVAENTFEKIKKSMDSDKYKKINLDFSDIEKEICFTKIILRQKDSDVLDENFARAIEKMELVKETYKKLPLIDCGACGSPTCRAFAEDVVKGLGTEEDCIFVLREKITKLTGDMENLTVNLPQIINAYKRED